MSDEPELTPEERLQAALDHLFRTARQWAMDAWQALEPVIERLADPPDDPAARARLRRLAEEDRAMVTPACQCECARVHPDAQVCDVKALTTVRDYAAEAGPVDIPVCAPCAAEAMAQPQ